MGPYNGMGSIFEAVLILLSVALDIWHIIFIPRFIYQSFHSLALSSPLFHVQALVLLEVPKTLIG